MSYITFDQVCKDYGQGEQVVHAADHVSFGIEQGELCVVLGPSGAGKTTILNLLGGMDTATSGEIRVGDKIVTAMRGKELTEYFSTVSRFKYSIAQIRMVNSPESPFFTIIETK